MTIHYEVQLDFEKIPSHTVLSTKDREKGIRQMLKIKEFLHLAVNRADLRYIDESTSNYKSKRA